MKNLSQKRLKKIVDNFVNISVLVVGDLMLDEFIWGEVSRISPEAPVPVVRCARESLMPGGASNVAHNMKSLGGTVFLSGVIGEDETGDKLIEVLRTRSIDTKGVVRCPDRLTTLKTRVIAHNQQVVRIDKEAAQDIDGAAVKSMLARLSGFVERVDAVIIEDYGKGVVIPPLVKGLIRLCRRHKKIIAVDPKENHFSLYKNTTVITPNFHEAVSACGLKTEGAHNVETIGSKLIKKMNCDVVLVTLGEKGMYLKERSGRSLMMPTVAQDVYDVSGAGDTVIGAYTMAAASGATSKEAAFIANCAAGIVVGKVGIAVTERRELMDKLRKELRKQRKRG